MTDFYKFQTPGDSIEFKILSFKSTLNGYAIEAKTTSGTGTVTLIGMTDGITKVFKQAKRIIKNHGVYNLKYCLTLIDKESTKNSGIYFNFKLLIIAGSEKYEFDTKEFPEISFDELIELIDK